MVHVTSYCVECKKKKCYQSREWQMFYKSHQRCPLVCSSDFSPCPAWRSCQIAGHPEWGLPPNSHYSSQIIWNSSIITYVVAQAVTVAPPGFCQSHHLRIWRLDSQNNFLLCCQAVLSHSQPHFTVMCAFASPTEILWGWALLLWTMHKEGLSLNWSLHHTSQALHGAVNMVGIRKLDLTTKKLVLFGVAEGHADFRWCIQTSPDLPILGWPYL